jgi:hypothetical protein
MALPDDADSLPDQAPDDEWASSRIIRLPPGDRSLAGTRHEGGDFMFAELAGVDLTEADFYWASFHNAILGRQRLTGRVARFQGADLTDAQFAGVTYDNNTIFPRDFKPDDAGIVPSGRESSATHKPWKR